MVPAFWPSHLCCWALKKYMPSTSIPRPLKPPGRILNAMVLPVIDWYWDCPNRSIYRKRTFWLPIFWPNLCASWQNLLQIRCNSAVIWYYRAFLKLRLASLTAYIVSGSRWMLLKYRKTGRACQEPGNLKAWFQVYIDQLFYGVVISVL